MQDPTIASNQQVGQTGAVPPSPNGSIPVTAQTPTPPASPSPSPVQGNTIASGGVNAFVSQAPKPPAPIEEVGKKDNEKRDTTERRTSGEIEVKKADIEKVVSNWTGIPITKLTEDEGAKLLSLEKRIHERLIDQEEAVTAVAEAVRRGRIGLAAANRPIASFIFLGPSGTGKTELAKTLAQILFGRDDALVRLDMSEYMEKHEVAKLIGAPPGYVGYEEGGQLTEAVRAKPYSIVLLDEVEKAHPDVFNILLQLLEDGRLTDNKGNTISFKNTIVICTSNIGSALITQKLGEKEGKELSEQEFDKEFAELTTLVSAELHKFFRPELLNRFDDIVIFKPLRRQDMAAIARLGIEKTGKLLEEQGIKLTITDKAIAQLALEGYDPIYGARPLRRLIQSSIENPIAILLIAKTFAPGDTILIDYDQAKSDYSFRKATSEEVTALAKDKEKKKDGVVEAKPQMTNEQSTPPPPTQQNQPSMAIGGSTPPSIVSPPPANASQGKPATPTDPSAPKDTVNTIKTG